MLHDLLLFEEQVTSQKPVEHPILEVFLLDVQIGVLLGLIELFLENINVLGWKIKKKKSQLERIFRSY